MLLMQGLRKWLSLQVEHYLPLSVRIQNIGGLGYSIYCHTYQAGIVSIIGLVGAGVWS